MACVVPGDWHSSRTKLSSWLGEASIEEEGQPERMAFSNSWSLQFDGRSRSRSRAQLELEQHSQDTPTVAAHSKDTGIVSLSKSSAVTCRALHGSQWSPSSVLNIRFLCDSSSMSMSMSMSCFRSYSSSSSFSSHSVCVCLAPGLTPDPWPGLIQPLSDTNKSKHDKTIETFSIFTFECVCILLHFAFVPF